MASIATGGFTKVVGPEILRQGHGAPVVDIASNAAKQAKAMVLPTRPPHLQ